MPPEAQRPDERTQFREFLPSTVRREEGRLLRLIFRLPLRRRRAISPAAFDASIAACRRAGARYRWHSASLPMLCDISFIIFYFAISARKWAIETILSALCERCSECLICEAANFCRRHLGDIVDFRLSYIAGFALYERRARSFIRRRLTRVLFILRCSRTTHALISAIRGLEDAGSRFISAVDVPIRFGTTLRFGVRRRLYRAIDFRSALHAR